jgi:hypothetical protein
MAAHAGQLLEKGLHVAFAPRCVIGMHGTTRMNVLDNLQSLLSCEDTDPGWNARLPQAA